MTASPPNDKAIELLPCPFCGGIVHVVKAHCADMSDWIQHDTRPVPCGLEGFGNFGDDIDVVTLWNTRAVLEEGGK